MATGSRTLPQQEKIMGLSSRKLWQLLDLNENKLTERNKSNKNNNKINKKQPHQALSEAIRKELIPRNDFDKGDNWKIPQS